MVDLESPRKDSLKMFLPEWKTFLFEITGMTILAYVCTRVTFGTAFFLLFAVRYQKYILRWVEREGEIEVGNFMIEKNRNVRVLLGLIVFMGFIMLYFL